MIIAVEIGFGDVKVITDEKKFKFPSVVAWRGSGMLRNWEDKGGYLLEGKEYVVGDEALGHPVRLL